MAVTQFIETMELLHVKGPKSNLLVVGDYLRADGPLEGKNYDVDPEVLEIDMDYSYM
jgi:hypothetical protein